MFSTDIALQLASAEQLSSMTSWNSGQQTNCTRQLSFAALPVSIRPYLMEAGNDTSRTDSRRADLARNQLPVCCLVLPALLPVCG